MQALLGISGGEAGTMSIVQSERCFDNDPGMALSAPLVAGEGDIMIPG